MKIIRSGSVGTRIWSSASGSWVTAPINTYLNNTYYNTLSDTAKKQILKGNFNVGAVSNTSSNMAAQIKEESSTMWNGNIGLPTLSEYLRANSTIKGCGTLRANDMNYANCRETNWMFQEKTNIWTSTQCKNYSDKVYAILYYGYSIYNIDRNSDSYSLYPTAYLTPQTKIIEGSGTYSNPYRIAN